ncbi:MAG TPA: TMEM175 family protein [Pseudonocardiaceae bacterium]|jgi:uncharacterized membrane protein|nr:TMEM175 family protein [Pseudonocardiaceae bacterium]
MTSTDKSPERLVFFSDAVVAIALTLLILPLTDVVGQFDAAHKSSIEVITENQWLVYGFLLSFVVILRQWIAHHRLYAQVKAYTMPLLWVNMAWVLSIAIIPFPTQMVAKFSGHDRFTLLFYVGTLFVGSVLLSAMMLIVRADRDVAKSADAISDRWRFTSLATTAGLGIAVLLVGVFPQLSYYPLLLIAVAPWVARLRYRKETKPTPEPA